MARYFFDLYECGTDILDDEGRDVADPASLHDLAIAEARSVMAAEVLEGNLCLSCRIEIRDAEHKPVLSLPFKAAITLTGV
jgi:hypothetical protein